VLVAAWTNAPEPELEPAAVTRVPVAAEAIHAPAPVEAANSRAPVAAEDY